jgi:hypothetical protein
MSARRINSSHGRVRAETVGASDLPMRERFASRGWRFAWWSARCSAFRSLSLAMAAGETGFGRNPSEEP